MSLVSILIPTYNQPEFFRQALESAIAQDYSEIEIIVSDDSTDDRVEKVASEYKDQIRFLKHRSEIKHVGYENVNYLLNQARGEFINFLFHDDLFMPQKISTMMKYFNDNVAFVTSRRYLIDDAGNVLNIWGSKDVASPAFFLTGEEIGNTLLINATNIVGELTSVLMRREDLFNPQTRRYEIGTFLGKSYPFHGDIPTWLELSRETDKVGIFVTEPLSAFRKSAEQVTQDISALLQIFIEFPEMIARAFLTNIFLHDGESLRKSCQQWLKNLNRSVTAIGHDAIYNSQKFSELDLLLQIVESLENEDYNLFLKLATSRKNS